MASFDENGKYIKTNWRAGDKITATKLNKIEESIEAVNDNDISRHVEADARLDALEAKDVAHDKEFTNVKNLIADNKAAAELGDYEINSRMTFLEDELNEGIEEVHNVAETVDGKIATAEANMTSAVNQGKADMEAMVAEVEADLEGLHDKDEELSEQLTTVENLNELKYSVKDFGVVGDGVTDDTEKLQQAIDSISEGSTLYLQNKTYIVTSTLIVNKSINIIGEGKRIGFNSSGYGNGMTEIRKVNGDTNGDAVMFIDGSEAQIKSATFSNIVFSASNSNTITYDTAVLPTKATNNTSYALKATNVHGCYFENIGVRQAKEVGLYITSGAVNVFRYCNACNNYLGMHLGVYDSCIEHSWANHNITHGLLVKGNYMRVMNCRFEWNAQNGIKSENGEGTFVGNLFDRNGFAGLYLTNAWGHVVTGNYFSRNGVSGDGNIGRFGFSVPGHPSYIETPEEECCHIRMNYMRDVTISGNRFRAGKDDAGQGANGPCCIYYFNNVTHCKTLGNAGEQQASGGFGGYTSHNLYEAAKLKKDSTSSTIFDYVENLPSKFNVSGSTNKELSEVSIPVSSSHMEIDIFGTKFQKTLRSKIIVNVGSSANLLHVIDYGTVTVSAKFDDNKQNVILTLSDKSWVRYNVKNFI